MDVANAAPAHDRSTRPPGTKSGGRAHFAQRGTRTASAPTRASTKVLAVRPVPPNPTVRVPQGLFPRSTTPEDESGRDETTEPYCEQRQSEHQVRPIGTVPLPPHVVHDRPSVPSQRGPHSDQTQHTDSSH
jgi:hypothetical protein